MITSYRMSGKTSHAGLLNAALRVAAGPLVRGQSTTEFTARRIAIISLLLNHGTEINAGVSQAATEGSIQEIAEPKQEEYTALKVALAAGHLEVVRFLLDNGPT
jgi:hypothetical protein